MRPSDVLFWPSKTHMPRPYPVILLFSILAAVPGLSAAAPTSTDAELERRFTQTVRPFINTYCVVCHSGKTPAAQFDLKSFSGLAQVVSDYPHWNTLLDKLNANQMPPSEARQPPAAAKQAVIAWVQAVRKNEAQKHAGDPGAVLARRLNNAEYNYS